MKLLLMLLVLVFFLSIKSKQTNNKKEKEKESKVANNGKTNNVPQEKKQSFRYSDNYYDMKCQIFDMAMAMYLSDTYKDLLDWKYEHDLPSYSAGCVHYMVYKNYVHLAFRDGTTKNTYILTEDVWKHKERKEEEVIIPIDEITEWIEKNYITQILPILKKEERNASGKGFTYSYTPEEKKDRSFFIEVTKRLSMNTNFLVSYEDNKLVFGLMAEPEI